MLVQLFQSLLDDDHGVSEDAYRLMVQVIKQQSPTVQSQLLDLLDRTEATDGRFYLPEE
jgi:hypothetical protein